MRWTPPDLSPRQLLTIQVLNMEPASSAPPDTACHEPATALAAQPACSPTFARHPLPPQVPRTPPARPPPAKAPHPAIAFHPSCRANRSHTLPHALAATHLLEAAPAQHRPSLRRLERYRRLRSTLRTRRPRLRTHPRPRRPLRLASLAALRIVRKLLLVEKQLFACGKHKLVSAVHTLQISVSEFHIRLP